MDTGLTFDEPTTRSSTEVIYAAGTGSAVTDLIFSIAKREVTFFKIGRAHV